MRLRPALALSVLVLLAPAVLAATITVNGGGDVLATDGVCTLREAILNANNNAATWPDCAGGAGTDVINLPAGTIAIAIPGIVEDFGMTGDYDVVGSVTINGHPSGTTITGNNLDRVFDINSWIFSTAVPPVTPITVFVNDLHITGANAVGDGGGMAVFQLATVTLTNVTISNCRTNNDAAGLSVSSDANVTLVNCTVTGNSCPWLASGIRNDGQLTISNSTVTNNRTTGGTPTRGQGIGSYGTTILKNTLIAGNGSAPGQPDTEGFFTSLGYNIIGNIDIITTVVPAAGDQFGVSTAAVSLAALANNGGPVPTHALNAGSVAIDQGHSFGVTSDARGLTRPCDQAAIANAAGGDGADIGAFEVQGVCAAANVAPDAVDDNANVNEDSGANSIAVLTNDSDANGDPLTITAVTQGAHGSVAINGSSVDYTPDANYFGSDSFTYTISDGSESDTATVTVTVANVNDAPVALGENYVIDQDTPLVVTAPGLLANDSDIDGDSLTSVSFTAAAHGSVAGAADGSFNYQPDPGYAGTDSFTYRVSDGLATTAPVTVHITINDTQGPAIDASLGTNLLWPPNQDLVNAGFTVSATDNGPGPITLSYAVFSDEDDTAPGSMSPDAKDIAPSTLRLRADRDANGNGRVYLVIVTATDAAANTSYSCLTAVAPKSQSAASIAAVNAEAAAAGTPCTGAAPAGWFVVGDGPVVGPKQ